MEVFLPDEVPYPLTVIHIDTCDQNIHFPANYIRQKYKMAETALRYINSDP